MLKSILSVIILIVLSCDISYGQGENFHMITLLSDTFNDLGFNNVLNQGRVDVAKALNIEDSRLKVVDGYNETISYLSPLLQEDGSIHLVLCTGLSHVEACKELALNYENHPLIKTQFILRGSGAATSNSMQFTYNYASINYISGVFAGLYTKTNKIGFISPGSSGGSNDSFVYAFWLGAKEANKDIEFYYYNIGSFLDKDKTIAATNELIDMGCDIIGDSIDDTSSGQTVISRGLYAMGTNGFPQRQVYGENVIYSYSYNWTKIFYPMIKGVIEGKPPKTMYGDFSNYTDSNLFDLQYGFGVSNETKQKIQVKIDHLTNLINMYGSSKGRALSPINCNPLMLPYSIKHNLVMSQLYGNTTCLSGSNFFFINAPLPGMTYLGYYNISLVKVSFPASLQIGISIASGILIVITLLLMVGTFVYRDTSSIRSASPIFLAFILFGAILVYVGIIVWVSSLNDHTCNARFWLVTIGFSTVIGSLVVKNFRIWLIFDNPVLKTVKITNYQLYPWVACCLLINIVLMSILTSVGDLREIDAQNIDSLGKYEYMRVCKMNHAGASTLYTILAYFGALLLTGVFVSWKIRIVDIEEFNESRAIAQTLYAISFCLFVIVPLMISPQDKQSETIVLCVAGFFIITSAVMIIFIPKFFRVYEFREEGTNEMFKSKKSSVIATARMESGNSAGVRSNRRGNLVSGDFSDDTESSIAEPNEVPKVTSGAVNEDLTSDDDVSEFGEVGDINDENNENNLDNKEIQLSETKTKEQLEQSEERQ